MRIIMLFEINKLNLIGIPVNIDLSLFWLIDLLYLTPGRTTPHSYATAKGKKNEKKKKCHRNSFSIKKKYRCYVICFVYSFIVLSYSSWRMTVTDD